VSLFARFDVEREACNRQPVAPFSRLSALTSTRRRLRNQLQIDFARPSPALFVHFLLRQSDRDPRAFEPTARAGQRDATPRTY
jgi:hypothetical protein